MLPKQKMGGKIKDVIMPMGGITWIFYEGRGSTRNIITLVSGVKMHSLYTQIKLFGNRQHPWCLPQYVDQKSISNGDQKGYG